MSKKKETEYNENNIQVLSDIDHIKLRRGMYIGEAETAFQLFSEILDNSLDELGEGHYVLSADEVSHISLYICIYI